MSNDGDHDDEHLDDDDTMSLPDDEQDEQKEDLTDSDREPTPVEARQHSYLPGTSHPLLPESKIQSGPIIRTTEIPILELPGVVVFPGSTLPIRLHHRQWIEYVGKRIHESRTLVSKDPVRIGILTHIPEERHRLSWMRTGGRRQSSELQELLLLRGLENNDDDDGEEEEEEGDVEIVERDEADNRPRVSGEEQRRRRDQQPRPRRQSRRSSSSLQQQQQQQQRDPLVDRIGTMVTVAYTQGDDQAGGRGRRDGAGDDAQDQSRVWRPLGNQTELIVKAIAS